jgi:NhaP-type Na+/H+ and K+/H+ antiporter
MRTDPTLYFLTITMNAIFWKNKHTATLKVEQTVEIVDLIGLGRMIVHGRSVLAYSR